ncbi:hypothetical protein LNO81_22015 [Klebsiella variicola subsp. variicola]|nr:hypothetical protein [Klebsiella variicola subsp. variicola]
MLDASEVQLDGAATLVLTLFRAAAAGPGFLPQRASGRQEKR